MLASAAMLLSLIRHILRLRTMLKGLCPKARLQLAIKKAPRISQPRRDAIIDDEIMSVPTSEDEGGRRRTLGEKQLREIGFEDVTTADRSPSDECAEPITVTEHELV